MQRRPLLVVGDVQGDYERLTDALAAYPEGDVDTIFLGDFFQGGRLGAAGGAEAARVAMRRRNTRAVLGNHDLFLLAVVEHGRGDSSVQSWQTKDGRNMEQLWLSRRGDWADVDAVTGDRELEAWLRHLPLLILLDDGTLIQHADDDSPLRVGATVADVNETVGHQLAESGGLYSVIRLVMGRHSFIDEAQLERYLAHFGARRVVHGHTPHGEDRPQQFHAGRVWSFDGRFSRYWAPEDSDRTGPIEATVALLPPMDRDC